MQDLKKTQKLKQLTLLEVVEQEIQLEPEYSYSTDYFTIKTNPAQLDSFNNKLNKTTRSGPKFNKEQKRMLKILFIQKKMKPIFANDITAEQYYLSKRSLLKRVFNMDL